MMLTTIFGVLVMIAAIGAMALMLVLSIDAALRETYRRHALRAAQEQYRKWCAQTPVEVESRLVIVCGKGYKEGGQR